MQLKLYYLQLSNVQIKMECHLNMELLIDMHSRFYIIDNSKLPCSLIHIISTELCPFLNDEIAIVYITTILIKAKIQ